MTLEQARTLNVGDRVEFKAGGYETFGVVVGKSELGLRIKVNGSVLDKGLGSSFLWEGTNWSLITLSPIQTLK